MDPEAGNSYQNGPGVGDAAQPPSSASSSQRLPGDGKIKELQSDVEQLTNVMQTNIKKVLDRGDRMDTLNERSELLTSRANEFRINTRSVRRKFWWQNLRYQIMIGVVITSLIIIIIYNLAHWSNGTDLSETKISILSIPSQITGCEVIGNRAWQSALQTMRAITF